MTTYDRLKVYLNRNDAEAFSDQLEMGVEDGIV